MLCNNAALGRTAEGDNGDPMELALLRVGRRAGLTRPALLTAYPVVHQHAFDTATKTMTTVHRHNDGYLFAVKGAPEAVLRSADDVPRRTRHRWQWRRPSARIGCTVSKISAIRGCACSPVL